MMRVRLFPSDATGCGRYRCTLPGETAKALGCDVTIAEVATGKPGDPPRRALPIQRHPQDQRLVRAVPVPADVVVFQRPVEEALARVVIPQLQAAGRAVVVEIDDDLHRIPPQHPAAWQANPARNRDANWAHLAYACSIADLVTVTCPALARRYGQHGRVAILPNCVPEALLAMPRASDGRTVGWRGWTVTHPGDLQSTRGGVQQALDRTGARFLQIGQPVGVKAALNLTAEPEATGALWDIHDFYTALGRLDVGIVPFADSQFNASKSCLAGIEYAARGVAFIASPVAEYRRLHEQGAGQLAGYRAREWSREIVRLLQDDTLRAERVEAGRQVVAEHYLIERRAHLWIEAWEQALSNARDRRPARIAA
ncbi:MAG: glycosyltransferase [Acidiferrobacteraceae bacterium]